MEPTYKQHKILESIPEEGREFDNCDLTNDHWELVRGGYVNNLVSFSHDWTFKITEKGGELSC